MIKPALTMLILLQVRTGVTMVQTEGYAALMSGVSATVARGLFYGGRLFVADSAASPLHPQLAAILATRYVSRCHVYQLSRR